MHGRQNVVWIEWSIIWGVSRQYISIGTSDFKSHEWCVCVVCVCVCVCGGGGGGGGVNILQVTM